MHFGITIKPDMSVERIVALTRQAEAAGFEYAGMDPLEVLDAGPATRNQCASRHAGKRRRDSTGSPHWASRNLTRCHTLAVDAYGRRGRRQSPTHRRQGFCRAVAVEANGLELKILRRAEIRWIGGHRDGHQATAVATATRET